MSESETGIVNVAGISEGSTLDKKTSTTQLILGSMLAKTFLAKTFGKKA